MVSIRFSILQPVLDMLMARTALEDDRQEQIEDALMAIVSRFFEILGQKISKDAFEVVWTVCQRTRNAPAISVDILFSERAPGDRGFGYVTTPTQRVLLRRQVTSYLRTAKHIPEVSIGVWVRPQYGAKHGYAMRKLKKKVKKRL